MKMNMKQTTRSILLAGVGGQGILRASDIIAMALMASGLDVKKSEVHGMAQRGGCVTSHVRYGEKVYSPIAKKGSVDILLSFEKLETLRYLSYVKPGGRIIINEEKIYPPSVNIGEADYPQDVVAIAKRYFRSVQSVDAASLALKAGNARAANTVMIGVVSRYMDVPLPVWEETLKEAFTEKLVAANRAAFKIGRSA
jgi:indolepyruvate ferredoxin oxidoreductase beta subunit